jgi:hypothetical protein
MVLPLLSRAGFSARTLGGTRMEPAVELNTGRIKGRRNGRTMVFRGIPYAADTGGAAADDAVRR